MNDKIFGFLGLAMRAGKLDTGEQRVRDRIRSENACLVILAEDASDNTKKKITDMFDSGVTVLFVSHSLAQVKRLCNKAMILDHGKLVGYGDIEEMAPIYQEMLDNCKDVELLPRRKKKSKKLRRLKKKQEEGNLS